MSKKVTIKGPGGNVIFEASVPVSESRQMNYDGYNIVHLPTSLHAYRNTDGRRWSISGKLVSRTVQEALQNIKYLDLIRKWGLPDFGHSGATPPILWLFAYGNVNINNRQCVIRSYSWNFPDDVDYIWESGQAMPVVGTLQVDLEEIYSAEQITAGAWDIAITGGGSFENGENNITSSLMMNFERRPSAFMVSGSSLSSSSSALGNSIGSIPGTIINNFTANLGMGVINSPQIQEVIRVLPPSINNAFVSGNSVIGNQANGVLNNVINNIDRTINNATNNIVNNVINSAASGLGNTIRNLFPGNQTSSQGPTDNLVPLDPIIIEDESQQYEEYIDSFGRVEDSPPEIIE